MAYQAAKLQRVRDNQLRILHPDDLEPKSYLTANLAAAGTALTLKSNSGFSNDDPQDLLLYEGYGVENAEIKRVNAAVTLGTALTSTAVTFAHGIDCPVSKILFDKVEISGASTATGSKTVIDTVAINVGGWSTDFVVTGTTYAYYFARYSNTLSTTTYFGDYSDAIAAAGFDPKNVGFIREQAFSAMGEKVGSKFSADWVYDQIYLGELEVSKRLKRWSWLLVEKYDAGNVTTGDLGFTLPTNIEDARTNKSILGLRIGKGDNMSYLDDTEYAESMEGSATTTLSAAVLTNDTSVTLTDSRDFDDSGTINIAGTSYAYTTNTRSTGVLSGMTAFSAGINNGTRVWQNVSFGEPMEYTIDNGEVKFFVPPSSDFSGRNLWLDYYRSVTRVDSDGDSITVNDPKVIISYLKMKIRERNANGELAATDPILLEFERGVEKLIQNELSGQHMSLVPSGSLRNNKHWVL